MEGIVPCSVRFREVVCGPRGSEYYRRDVCVCLVYVLLFPSPALHSGVCVCLVEEECLRTSLLGDSVAVQALSQALWRILSVSLLNSGYLIIDIFNQS